MIRDDDDGDWDDEQHDKAKRDVHDDDDLEEVLNSLWEGCSRRSCKQRRCHFSLDP